MYQITYILLGIVPWIFLIVLSAFARGRLRRLEDDRSTLASPPPKLAVVVPARNEEGGIADCITRLEQQEYLDARVIVVNDRSTDSTGKLLDELQSRSPAWLQIIHVEDLPEGWLGKCHALHVGTRDLDVEWIMFVDSDVTLEPNALRRIVACSATRGYDAMSVMPALDARSMLECSLLPLLAVCWSVMFQISLTNDDSRPHHAYANGQLFLIRKSWYEKVGGHARVRAQIVEDVMLMRELKRAGAKCRFFFGQSFARCRMHTNLKQMFNGWARIFAGSSQRRVMPILSALAFLALQPLLMLMALRFILLNDLDTSHWAVLLLIHVSLILGFAAWCYHGARQRISNILLLPLSVPLLLLILANAVRVCFSGKVDWRGNYVSVNE